MAAQPPQASPVSQAHATYTHGQDAGDLAARARELGLERRAHLGNFASDDAVMREYIKALAQSGQLSRLSLSQLSGQGGELAMAQRIAGAPHAMDGLQPQGGVRGTTEEPLHVQWHESPRAQMWKMLRMLK